MITITIVEDSEEFAHYLREKINEQEDMTCISIYHTAKEAKKNLLKDNADVVVMDILLQDDKINGVDLVKYFIQNGSSSLFVMCTSFDNDDAVFQSLLNGALGYILKSDDLDKIIGDLRDVVNGGSPMSMSIARKVVESMHRKGKELEPLTPRERELLELFSEGLLYKEVAEKMNIKHGTVRKHAHNIYQKLQVTNKLEAINKLKNNKL